MDRLMIGARLQPQTAEVKKASFRNTAMSQLTKSRKSTCQSESDNSNLISPSPASSPSVVTRSRARKHSYPGIPASADVTSCGDPRAQIACNRGSLRGRGRKEGRGCGSVCKDLGGPCARFRSPPAHPPGRAPHPSPLLGPGRGPSPPPGKGSSAGPSSVAGADGTPYEGLLSPQCRLRLPGMSGGVVTQWPRSVPEPKERAWKGPPKAGSSRTPPR